MTVDGSTAAVDAFLATPAGEHMALEMARKVIDDPGAFEAYAIGRTRHPGAVEVHLDRALDALARNADAEVRRLEQEFGR